MSIHPLPALACLLLTFCTAAHAVASECDGVRLPDVVESEGTTLQLNGAGVRSVSYLFLEIDVYVAALYLERPAAIASEVLDSPSASRLALHFRRAVPRTQLTEGFSEAFERAAPEQASLHARLERLNDWMRDMDAGSELTFAYVPGAGVVVTVAGLHRGTIPGADFARTLMGNWLGPHAIDPNLEAGLLGAPCV